MPSSRRWLAALLPLLVLAASLVGAAPASAATVPGVLPLKAETFYTSSMYGPRCLPVAGASAQHLGIDLEAQRGAPIYASVGGTVTAAVNPKGGNAGYVVVRTTVASTTYYVAYVHMDSATKYVSTGQRVAKGQRIALVGSSGPATSPHLHVEVWKGAFHGTGTTVDPVRWFTLRGVSIAKGAIFDQRVRETSCTYYASTSLNVRSGPSTGYKVLRTVSRGTAMRSTPGRLTNGFVPVTIGSTKGWVSSSYVLADKPGTSTAAPRYTTLRASSVWIGPSSGYRKVRKIPKGATISTVYARIGNYTDVQYGSTRGFVWTANLQRK
ncbi:SH3 domain-containing protein [Sediminihabitans luteus]|uniref:SH3 domain-containing protein n=1 Tax=Sediminihabitans luteus TaxID=1138585 RepID=A0A2M9D0U3_9CELL|nr:peptidoglycan DD-metalloendopeptidase family protein [Sediminihabitans luteus]PJJ77812.1 SH3 domain-containing protein [Sediminihabitans luteus]GII99830.1 hypothetical protein Slu03_22080 [Sediminihabitans luteus]